ncbi:hypothetical protein D3C77_424440 [compost metagenome]
MPVDQLALAVALILFVYGPFTVAAVNPADWLIHRVWKRGVPVRSLLAMALELATIEAVGNDLTDGLDHPVLGV